MVFGRKRKSFPLILVYKNVFTGLNILLLISRNLVAAFKHATPRFHDFLSNDVGFFTASFISNPRFSFRDYYWCFLRETYIFAAIIFGRRKMDRLPLQEQQRIFPGLLSKIIQRDDLCIRNFRLFIFVHGMI